MMMMMMMMMVVIMTTTIWSPGGRVGSLNERRLTMFNGMQSTTNKNISDSHRRRTTTD